MKARLAAGVQALGKSNRTLNIFGCDRVLRGKGGMLSVSICGSNTTFWGLLLLAESPKTMKLERTNKGATQRHAIQK